MKKSRLQQEIEEWARIVDTDATRQAWENISGEKIEKSERLQKQVSDADVKVVAKAKKSKNRKIVKMPVVSYPVVTEDFRIDARQVSRNIMDRIKRAVAGVNAKLQLEGKMAVYFNVMKIGTGMTTNEIVADALRLYFTTNRDLIKEMLKRMYDEL